VDVTPSNGEREQSRSFCFPWSRMKDIHVLIDRYEGAHWPWVCIITTIALVVMSGFLLQGVPEGYDVAQHIRFAAAYHDAFLNGSFFPGWSAVDNFGYGSVGIRFYPPFADYVLALTQIFTNDWYESLVLNSVFWMIPGCIGIYLWLREYQRAYVATMAALLYCLMPYHLLQIYEFQLYSEFAAASIAPFCFLFATRLIRKDSLSNQLGLSVSCALLILTHLPSSIIVLSSLFVYSLIMFRTERFREILFRFTFAALTTIALTSFYLARLITELDWVQHSSAQFSTGFYDHHRHFFPIISNFGDWYWYLMLWQIDLTTIVTLLMLAPICIYLVYGKRFVENGSAEWRGMLAVAVTGLYSLFMLSVLSGPIWNSVPMIEKIQFPWRFLSVSTIMSSISFVFAVSYFSVNKIKYKRLIIYPTVALFVGIALFDLTQIVLMAGPLDRGKFYESVVDKRADESCSCWWPTWGRREAFQNDQLVSAGDRMIEITNWNTMSRSIELEKGQQEFVRIATFYYPYWKASVNGIAARVSMDENGAMLIGIPPERSEVRLYFEEPPLIKVSNAVSLISWLGLIVAIALLLIKQSRIKRQLN
jgi:hypothetical protein